MKERNLYVWLGLTVLLFSFPFSLPALCVLFGVDLRIGMTWLLAVFWGEEAEMCPNLHLLEGDQKIQLLPGHEEASRRQRSIKANSQLQQGLFEANQVWKEMVDVALFIWRPPFSSSCCEGDMCEVGWCHQGVLQKVASGSLWRSSHQIPKHILFQRAWTLP